MSTCICSSKHPYECFEIRYGVRRKYDGTDEECSCGCHDEHGAEPENDHYDEPNGNARLGEGGIDYPPPVPAGDKQPESHVDYLLIASRQLVKDAAAEHATASALDSSVHELTAQLLEHVAFQLVSKSTAISSLREAVKGCEKHFDFSSDRRRYRRCGRGAGMLCGDCEQAKYAAITNLTGETTT